MAIKKADRVITVSDSIARHMEEVFQLSKSVTSNLKMFLFFEKYENQSY
jgi:hypothetical protein